MVTFTLLAILMVAGALGVVLLKQPMHAALSLVATLLTLAIVYVTLQAHFLAAIQVIVYAGAIMVLFLFVLMLLNVQGLVGPQRSLPAARWVGAAAALLTALAVIAVVFADVRAVPDAAVVADNLQGGSAAGIADALFGPLLLPFHLVGVLLLTGVVGAVALVQRRAESATGSQLQPRADALQQPEGGAS